MRRRSVTRLTPWLSVKRLTRRAFRQIPDADTPMAVAGSAVNAQLGEAMARLEKRAKPTAAGLALLESMLAAVEAAHKVSEAAANKLRKARKKGYANRLALVVWAVLWVPVTGIDVAVSKLLIDRLFRELDDRLVWVAVSGVAAITLMTGHELGTSVLNWTKTAMTGETRRRAIASIGFAVIFYGALIAGIAITGSPAVNYIVVVLAGLMSTLLYSLKPSAEFTDRVRLWFDARFSERRTRATLARAHRQAHRVVDEYNGLTTYWLGECRQAAATGSFWGIDKDMPTADAVHGDMDWLSNAGIGVTRTAIDRALSRLGKFGVPVRAKLIVLNPSDRRWLRRSA